MNSIIEIQHLNKSYGPVRAVRDLSFQVREGELFAFLGINGAGKSTTINIMCGQLAKDAGSVHIGGIDLDADPDGTSLLRNHALRGVFEEMDAQGFPPRIVEAIRDSVDCNLYFFDHQVSNGQMYLILVGSIAVLVALYVVINRVAGRRGAR